MAHKSTKQNNKAYSGKHHLSHVSIANELHENPQSIALFLMETQTSEWMNKLVRLNERIKRCHGSSNQPVIQHKVWLKLCDAV